MATKDPKDLLPTGSVSFTQEAQAPWHCMEMEQGKGIFAILLKLKTTCGHLNQPEAVKCAKCGAVRVQLLAIG